MKQLVILLFACGLIIAGHSAIAATVAKVDGIEISDEMFEAFATSRARMPAADLTAEQRTALTEELYKLVAISAEARKKKIQNDETIAAQMKLQELSFLAQSYIQRHLTENPPTAAQMQALYDKKYGAGGTEYKARHILVQSPTEATDIIGQLSNGADFAGLAAKHSTGPSAQSGGDLGWFAKDAMVKEFADAVAAMKSGTHTTTPVQTQYGWHVILKEDERVMPAPDMNSVTEELQRELQQEAIQTLVDGVRAKAKVKTYN